MKNTSRFNSEYSRSLRRISRRRFLQGSGVLLALPVLDCLGADEVKKNPPKRMLLISNNLGVLPKPFFPESTGSNYQLSPYLEEIKDFQSELTVFSGLSHPNVEGGHSTENCFLTAAKNPTSSGFRNEISLDQFAADQLGRQTRFSTLNLGVNIDKANRSLSWTRDGILLPAEDSPSKLFQKMFVQGNKSEVEQRLNLLRKRGSILDAVTDSSRRFQKNLGADDQKRLDQYFTSIRELENRLHAEGEWEQKPKPKPEIEQPVDIIERSRLFEKYEQMLSMAYLALQSDSTRIVTLMVDAFATPVFELDDSQKSSTGYHDLSHHGSLPANLAQLEKADRNQMRILNQLLVKMKETRSESGNLLDQTMVLYGSNLGDANTHDNRNLPILLAGGGFQHGKHLAFNRENNTPLSNLFVSMLQKMEIPTDQFGSSTGTLTGLNG